MTGLLPSNATKLERDFMDTVAAEYANQVDIATIFDPATCPVAFLPWLAYAFSVDVWDDNWSEAQKRAIIDASFATHQYKGTPQSIKDQIAALGYTPEIEEWFEFNKPPCSFAVNIDIGDAAFNDAMVEPVLRIIAAFKNLRSYLEIARFGRWVAGPIYYGGYSQSGSIVTSGPYTY